MVFASHGRVMSEAEIRTMCDCTPLGTEALKAVYDPLHGERHLPRATFESAWAMLHNLAILVHE
jgi:hypothetical protein